MRTLTVIFVALLCVTALTACFSRTREIHITNNTGQPIDVTFVKNTPPYKSGWQDYEGKQVGDDDPSTGCELCNLEPGETDYITRMIDNKHDKLKFVARDASDRKIVFIGAMTAREVSDDDWTVVVQ